ERLCAVRDRIAPRVPICILSNSTTAAWADVRRGLSLYDERHMKLDAGDPITYSRLNGYVGSRASVRQIVESLRMLPSIVIQAMFVTEPAHQIDNSTEGAVAEWLTAIESLKAVGVHIYTIDRPPALDALQPVPRRRLREIAEHVRAAGIPALVFGGS